jgi:hypothetical protein
MGLFGGNAIEMAKNFGRGLATGVGKVLDFFTGGESPEEARAALQNAADAAALEIMRTDLLPLLKQRLVDTDHVFTGALLESLDVWSSQPGQIVVGSREFGERLSRIEYGTEPRNVDDEELDRLVFWVEDKFGIVDKKQAEASALGVALKLETQGNTAYRELTSVIEENRDAILAEITRRTWSGMSQNINISVPRET